MVQQAKTMTAAEYATLPETTQPMELIHGEVIVSPAPKDTHQRIIVKLLFLLKTVTEEAGLDGRLVISPSDVYFSDNTVLQPDVFWVSAKTDQCQLGDDDYWHGAPDLVVEVLSPGTAVRDKRDKFEIYQQHGVREYWLVDASYVEVWRLTDGAFARVGVFGAEQSFKSAVLNDRDIQLEQVL